MSQDDNFDKGKFLKEIRKAIPKYEKTIKRLIVFIDELPKDSKVRENLVIEKSKIEKAINDLKITEAVYSGSKTEADFAEEDFGKEDFDTEAKQAFKTGEEANKPFEKMFKKVQQDSFRSKYLAFGILIITAGLAIGLTFVATGMTTSSQLDIFLLTNNVTAFDEIKQQDYLDLRENARLSNAAGILIIASTYAAGIMIITKKINVED